MLLWILSSSKLLLFLSPPFFYFLTTMLYYKTVSSKKENIVHNYIDQINNKIIENQFYKTYLIPFNHKQINFFDELIKNSAEDAYKAMLFELAKNKLMFLLTKPATYVFQSASILFLYSFYYSTRYSIISPSANMIRNQKLFFRLALNLCQIAGRKSYFFIRFFKGF